MTPTAAPRRVPHGIDTAAERLLLVELTPAEIAQASFLDQRILTPQTRGQWVDLAALSPTGAQRDDAQWIFHIGQCGSTLLSRLLGALPGVVALREPQALRDLAAIGADPDAPTNPWSPATWQAHAAAVRAALARVATDGERSLVKATSMVSDIAPALVAPDARAVLLHVAPDRYLETILAGENSRRALPATAAARLARLHRRIGTDPWRLWALDEGERVALGWATEMTALDAAAQTLPPGAALWIDFDGFLADPGDGLARIAAHFGIVATPDDIAAAVRGPTMHRYSKAPEHAFDPAMRRALLARTRAEHRTAIGRGHAWLAAAAAHPPIAAALARAKGSPQCSS